MVVRLAVILLALSFFSFSKSALFVTVLVKGTRGFGDVLVMVLGLAERADGFGEDVVRVVVVVVVLAVVAAAVLAVVVPVVVLLLNGTLGLGAAAVFGGDDKVAGLGAVVLGAVAGLGAVVFVVFGFGAAAVAGRVIVRVAGASVEVFFASNVLGAGFTSVEVVGFFSVVLEAAVAVFGLDAVVVEVVVFDAAPAGLVVPGFAGTFAATPGFDAAGLGGALTALTLGVPVDFLGSGLPIGFFPEVGAVFFSSGLGVSLTSRVTGTIGSGAKTGVSFGASLTSS